MKGLAEGLPAVLSPGGFSSQFSSTKAPMWGKQGNSEQQLCDGLITGEMLSPVQGNLISNLSLMKMK